MTDWMDPETFWLNATNLLLGLVTLAALLLVVVGLGVDLVERWRVHRVAAAGRAELHVLQVPALGLTMADGGERVDETQATGDRQEERKAG